MYYIRLPRAKPSITEHSIPFGTNIPQEGIRVELPEFDCREHSAMAQDKHI